MLTILDHPDIRPGAAADSGVELLLDPGILLKHGDEGTAQDAAQLALQVRPHVLQIGREYCFQPLQYLVTVAIPLRVLQLPFADGSIPYIEALKANPGRPSRMQSTSV